MSMDAPRSGGSSGGAAGGPARRPFFRRRKTCPFLFFRTGRRQFS